MTISEMRLLLGLGIEASDAEVVAAYVAYLDGLPPPTEPILLQEAKVQLRLGASTAEDALIEGHIAAAREWVEIETGLVLTPRPITQVADGFEPWLDLRAWPIRSIASVAYRDSQGVMQALHASGYITSLARRPVRLIAGLGGLWPPVARGPGGVVVVVEAGFANAAAVPQALKRAMLIITTSLYEDRSGEPSDAAVRSAKSWCRGSRLRRV